MTSHTAGLTSQQAEDLRLILQRDGFEFIDRPHTLFAARKDKLNVSVYQKGPKVLIQGRHTEDFVRFTLEPQVLGEAKLGYEEIHNPDMFQPHFGIDESGKGDFFGPLVIAGVYTDKSTTRALIDAGVTDSKRISSPSRIRSLAAHIRELPGIATAVIAIGPERYNELHRSLGNLNRLLAWGHARAIASLVNQRPQCPRALSDQFAHPQVLRRALRDQNIRIQLDQRTKGESDTAVAAASILARERFIDWIAKTSTASGIDLPLGASNAVVKAGKKLIAQHGPDVLNRCAKTHFRTSARILDQNRPDGTESA